MTKLSQTCPRTTGYFVFVFPSRLPLGNICHQRQVADSIRFDPILISGNRTEKSLRTHNKRLIVFKNLNINNRQSLGRRPSSNVSVTVYWPSHAPAKIKRGGHFGVLTGMWICAAQKNLRIARFFSSIPF